MCGLRSDRKWTQFDALLKVMTIISEELNYWIGLTDFADGYNYNALATMLTTLPI